MVPCAMRTVLSLRDDLRRCESTQGALSAKVSTCLVQFDAIQASVRTELAVPASSQVAERLLLVVVVVRVYV